MRRSWILAVLIVAACGGGDDHPIPGASVERGRTALQTYSCGACHEINGVPGANGRVGPDLARLHDQTMIAGRLPNSVDNLVRWIREPQTVSPGNAMPNLGVDERHARDMAAYIYTLR